MKPKDGSSIVNSAKSFSCNPSNEAQSGVSDNGAKDIANQYKKPDLWVSFGQNLQLTESKSHQKSMPITIGIDFGTAFTKASVGIMDKIFIVNWAGISDGPAKFTLPGEVSVLRNGRCVLGRAPTAKRILSNLKKPFLTDGPSPQDISHAALFIALVIRYIRAWTFHHYGALIGDKKVIWSLNIGIPSRPAESHALRDIYQDLALFSWRLSFQQKAICLGSTTRVSRMCTIEGDDQLEAVDVIPEFVAQIASYIRSPQRQPDLHMIMDVGAGTIDIATFNVHRQDGEDVFPIFASAVEPLGTHFLNERRINLLTTRSSAVYDDFSPVLSATEFSKRFNTTRTKISACDNEHAVDVARAISLIIAKTKTWRYRLSRNWESGVRVFFCGGGSECKVFSDALDSAAVKQGVTLRKTHLPLPANIEAKGLNHREYHRVAVAYGLGIFSGNLGKIILASEVPDDPPPSSRRVKERPDRDELYPK